MKSYFGGHKELEDPFTEMSVGHSLCTDRVVYSLLLLFFVVVVFFGLVLFFMSFSFSIFCLFVVFFSTFVVFLFVGVFVLFCCFGTQVSFLSHLMRQSQTMQIC